MRTSIFFVSTIVFLASILITEEAIATASVGKVAYLSGQPWVINDTKKLPLKEGDVVFPGDIVVTDEGSRAKLEMSDGSRIYVGRRSRIEIENYEMDNDRLVNGFINMLWGKARFLVNKLQTSRASFSVRTVTATIGVRGTEFAVVVPHPDKLSSQVALQHRPTISIPKKPTTLMLFEGSVVGKAINGKTQLIKPNQLAQFRINGAISVRKISKTDIKSLDIAPLVRPTKKGDDLKRDQGRKVGPVNPDEVKGEGRRIGPVDPGKRISPKPGLKEIDKPDLDRKVAPVERKKIDTPTEKPALSPMKAPTSPAVTPKLAPTTPTRTLSPTAPTKTAPVSTPVKPATTVPVAPTRTLSPTVPTKTAPVSTPVKPTSSVPVAPTRTLSPTVPTKTAPVSTPVKPATTVPVTPTRTLSPTVPTKTTPISVPVKPTVTVPIVPTRTLSPTVPVITAPAPTTIVKPTILVPTTTIKPMIGTISR